MIFTIPERIALSDILPQQGDFLTVKRVEEARGLLILTPDEQSRFGVVVSNDELGKGTLTWNKDVDTSADIALGEVVSDKVTSSLKKMNDEGTLSARYISLYEKFVEKKPAQESLQPATE